MPERFELAFGLPPDEGRDPASMPEPAIVDGRFQLRGSIDLVERNPRTDALRVTDHKTGKNRTTRATIVDGGRVLQPVLYGLALESLTANSSTKAGCGTAPRPATSRSTRFSSATSARRSGIEVLEIIDRAVEHGPLAARPARDACRWCDFPRSAAATRSAAPVASCRRCLRPRRAPEDAVTDERRRTPG